MTIQTAVLIETLIDLGAEVRWSSCNIYSTQDHAAAAIAKNGIAVFAWKDESEDEYMWCIEQTLIFEEGKGPNMLLDDGGDLTQVVLEKDATFISKIKGVSEETTTGVHRLYQLAKDNKLPFPVILDFDKSIKNAFKNIKLTPTSILIDRNGKLINTIIGEIDFTTFNKLLEEELKKKGFDYSDNEFDYSSPIEKKSPYKKGIGKYAKKAKGSRGYKMKRK